MGTRPCELVCRGAFKATAASRLVTNPLGMGARACVNVRTRVVNVEAPVVVAASVDGMVSAAYVAAGANVYVACVPMHGADLRMVAAEKSSMPGLVTGVGDGFSSSAAGADGGMANANDRRGSCGGIQVAYLVDGHGVVCWSAEGCDTGNAERVTALIEQLLREK
jgi:hypothetical protein